MLEYIVLKRNREARALLYFILLGKELIQLTLDGKILICSGNEQE